MRLISHVVSFLCVVLPYAAAAAGGYTHVLGPDVSMSAHQIVVNPDDTILIAGSILTVDPKTRVHQYDTFVLKLLADGTPDAQFGTTGWVRQPGNLFRRMAVLQEGSILISACGSEGTKAGNTYFYLGKLTRNGQLDSGFGEQGRVIADFTEHEDGPDGMVLHADGKISLIGIRSPEFGFGVPQYLEVVRVTSDGKPDNSIGTGGKLRTRVPWTNLKVEWVLQRGRGGFLLLCEVEAWENDHSVNSTGSYFLAALDGRGKPDMNFGHGGKLALTQVSQAGIVDTLQLPDGSILLTGDVGGSDGGGPSGFIAKLTPEGSPDRAFGVGGVVRMPVRAQGIAVDKSGKVYVSGSDRSEGSSLAVARFSSVGVPDAAFGQGGIVQESVAGGTASGDRSVLAVSPRSGRVVVAGVTFRKAGQDGSDSHNTDVLVARFAPNGIFDADSFGVGDIAFAGPKAVRGERGSVRMTGGGQQQASTGDEPSPVTGTIGTIILKQPVIGVRVDNGVASEMLGKPYVVFTLKETPDVEYAMAFTAAASAGLVKVDKFDDEGIPQNAEIRPVRGWQVKVTYHKEGKTNQVDEFKRLRGNATRRPAKKRSGADPGSSPHRQPAAR